MSLYDLSRLTGSVPVRGINATGGRETAEARPDKPRANSAAVADKGVAVQTGAKVSAGAAPVDSDRVEQIRDALRDGSYPIVPARITDAMIAARLLLSTSQ